jgi:hypothetical protein
MGRVNNDDLIKAIFHAAQEAKERAVEILTGSDPAKAKPPARLLTIKQAADRKRGDRLCASQSAARIPESALLGDK